ncbi:DUF4190 domain-containing protein [Mycobacterium sp. MYCO198283]|uniref:DUF4190 domain-containing protein n=1 Tax=Mycobacterium sp. MYCO198283 TaxID=2883505 RepID=UPI001E4811D6|nr:DUF4190 domain-containing protein [Mycobacterium sp. MYCO198283]MCG5430768.1 DUF4190 domain-containing protein [Mycobacterium sp. MYCO198283]
MSTPDDNKPDDLQTGAHEYPSLENPTSPPPDPYAPVDYPAYPPPPPPAMPPPVYPGAMPGYPGAYPPYPSAGYPAYGSRGTNGQALASLITALVGVPLCWLFGIPSIVAIVLGVVGLAEIKKTGQDGRGMAITGIVVGALTIVLSLIAFVAILATDTSGSTTYY